MKTELTKEQSQHLIDLGVPKEKASGGIAVVPIGEGIRGIANIPYHPIFKLEDFLNGEILPHEIGYKSDMFINLDIALYKNCACVGYWDSVNDEYLNFVKHTEFIDALYELACWYYGEYLKSEEEKWEYKRILAGRGGGICQSSLERLKSEGWELDAQNGLEYTFKRKIEE